MPELDQSLAGWQESPIAALNPWYPLCSDPTGWRACVPSAIAFLCGSFPDQVSVWGGGGVWIRYLYLLLFEGT